LRELQYRKLSRLLRHAYSQVPYYRQLFDAGRIRPEDIRTLNDVRHIPVTRRQIYRGVPAEERLAAGSERERLIVRRTSGSTGIPLSVYFTPQELALHALLTLRSEVEVGVGLTDHLAMMGPPGQEYGANWLASVGVLRKTFVNVLEDVTTRVSHFRRLRPDALVGAASQIRLLAQGMRDQSILDVRIDRVFAHSGPLFDEARALIGSAFGAEVFSRYDTWETHLVGWECERHDGWHIDCDHVLLECLEDGRPATGSGEVVVTNLDTYAMPIIRYALDDVATLEPDPCVCGRTFPRLQAIHGRLSDVLLLPDGRRLDFLVMSLIFRDLEAVAQYRVVQESLDSFRLEIVPARGFTLASLHPVVARFHEQCGADLLLRVVIRDQMDMSTSAKWRFLVSEVPGGNRS
jgi:phenylacetate-CoA ligase